MVPCIEMQILAQIEVLNKIRKCILNLKCIALNSLPIKFSNAALLKNPFLFVD